MKFLFVKSNLPISKLITWGLKEPVSHCMVLFDNEFVMHSSLHGVELRRYSEIKNVYTIVHELDWRPAESSEDKIYKYLLSRYDNYPYDFGAFLYFCFCVIKNKLFKAPMPVKNKWGSKRSFLCTGFLGSLRFLDIKIDEDTEMMSPYKLYLKLKEVLKL